MTKVHRALHSLPARPALIIAPVLILAVLAFYYGGQYQRCTGKAELRARLGDAIAAAGSGGIVSFSEITDSSWDAAFIETGYQTQAAPADCAFGWDWSPEERARLIAEGRLTMIVFSRGGQPVDYLEHDSDHGRFVDIENPYSPEGARFIVDGGVTGGGYLLRPAGNLN